MTSCPSFHFGGIARASCAVLVALYAVAGSASASAQDQPVVPASAPPQTPAESDQAKPGDTQTRNVASRLVHNLGDDIKHLPRRNSVYWLAGGAAASFAVHYADNSVNRRLTGSAAADKFFVPGKYIGATEVQIAASLATMVFGSMQDKPRVEHLGMDLLEAQILTEGIVEGAKLAIRRQRPVNPDGSRAPGYSFPSGHAAVTFASATVLQQHLGWKAAVPTFTVAAYVATSRLHDNRHFLSDVVFGAATGIIVGRSVTWHGRNTYTIAFLPQPGGVSGRITW
jgi:membrane-associated phospholipid phosphatase